MIWFANAQGSVKIRLACSNIFPANISLGEDVLEDVFSVTISCLSRRLKDVLKKMSCRHVLKTSWRSLENVLKFSFEEILKTSWKPFQKTHCKYVLKTSWKTKNCYAEDVLENKKCFLGCWWLILNDYIKSDKYFFFIKVSTTNFLLKLSYL